VPETQLELMPACRPLLEKFGREFFKAVPARPGVYVMTGRGERVLYVGQSGNLHARLGTYKNARTGKTSRKTQRLVHSVESITWELCSNAREARLRENALLRLHRPRFNRLNTYPAAYNFISLKVSPRELEFARTTSPSGPGRLFGAFKGHVHGGYASLLRLTWAALNKPNGIHAFPHRLLANRAPSPWVLPVAPHIGGDSLGLLLSGFLEGTSDALLNWLTGRLPPLDSLHPFYRVFQESALDNLQTFFLVGPKRNRALMEQHGLEGGLIPQERLDDLLVGKI
jgi:predicted GIY-YIG superfamily endonuclease